DLLGSVEFEVGAKLARVGEGGLLSAKGLIVALSLLELLEEEVRDVFDLDVRRERADLGIGAEQVTDLVLGGTVRRRMEHACDPLEKDPVPMRFEIVGR